MSSTFQSQGTSPVVQEDYLGTVSTLGKNLRAADSIPRESLNQTMMDYPADVHLAGLPRGDREREMANTIRTKNSPPSKLSQHSEFENVQPASKPYQKPLASLALADSHLMLGGRNSQLTEAGRPFAHGLQLPAAQSPTTTAHPPNQQRRSNFGQSTLKFIHSKNHGSGPHRKDGAPPLDLSDVRYIRSRVEFEDKYQTLKENQRAERFMKHKLHAKAIFPNLAVSPTARQDARRDTSNWDEEGQTYIFEQN